MRILVVDDDPWSARIASRVLGLRGHAVECRTTFASARAALVDSTHDVILLDIDLPGGRGDELLAELRVRDQRLPVIAVTSSAMIGDREKFLRQGFTAYLSKPIDVRTFGDTIERLSKVTP